MKNLFNNISESEKNRIIEMHINKTKNLYLTEAQGGGTPSTEKPAQETFTLGKAKKLSGEDLFPTGSSTVDTKSQSFQKALTDLRRVGSGTVEVQGGASAIGSKQGFNNKELAMQRARNFVKALKDNGITDANFVIIGGKVGNIEDLNDPNAKKEQFVKYAFDDITPITYKQTTAIDNTAVKLKQPPPTAGEIDKYNKQFVIVYEVTYQPGKKQFFKDIDSSLRGALQGKVISVDNITKKVYK